MTFENLGLKKELISAIKKMGFESPTPIQEQAIPTLIKEERDLIGLAQTGTGKTAAFGLPLIHKIDCDNKTVQGLIICPTRELCLQITGDLKNFSSELKKAKIVPVYGGTDIVRQMKLVKENPQIIVATPGRLLDLIKRKAIQLNNVHYVILDEADEMLNMGFKEDIDDILKMTPKEKSVWLFSATMPKEVAAIASNYMTNPFEITVGNKNESAKNIEHIYYTVNERKKYDALRRIADAEKDIFGVVFCRTRLNTQKVADMLVSDGYYAEALHGDLSQAQRDRVMEKFRNRTIKLLVATDVAARGIDVNDVTHVIHYQLPEDIENYTHRSGRTARAGKSGKSLCFINPKEYGKIKSIEKKLQIAFKEGTVPDPEEVFNKRIISFIDNLLEAPKSKGLKINNLNSIYKKFDKLSKEEIIEKFIDNIFESQFKKYTTSENLNLQPDREANINSRDGRRNRRNDKGNSRYFVNIGKTSGLNPGALVRVICEETGLTGNDIGKIDIKENFAFFETDKVYEDRILSELKRASFEGKKLRVEVSQAPRSNSTSSEGKRKKSHKGGKNKSDKKKQKNRFF